MFVAAADVFEQTVIKYPNKEALYDVHKHVRWTYAEWDAQVNRLANAFLAAGVRKGDRVSAFLYNGHEFATTYFACAKIGAVFNPINFRLKASELGFIVQDAAPKIVVFERALESEVAPVASKSAGVAFWCVDGDVPPYSESYADRVAGARADRPEADVSERDYYALMYTSGTTGRPKGVLHRHRELIEQSMAVIGTMHYVEEDKGLVASPLFHCGELHSGFFARVHVGAGNVLMRQFNAKQVVELIASERITMAGCVPTAWRMLLREERSGADLSSLRIGMYGGEAMAPSLVTACIEAFGIDLVQAYGMTEMGPGIAYLFLPKEAPPIDKTGSAGKAALNHEIRIARYAEDRPSDPDDTVPTGEVGEIVVRGNCVMAGYLHRPEATAAVLERGWYRTGDLGYLDADGYLWVVDRKNNMIVSGGENIYPREVEHALSAHPDVEDVAVVGTPDPKWGETVVAFVVRKRPVTELELDAFCKSNLAGYKRPRIYRFLDALPRNGSGKILYPELKKLAEQ